MLDNISLSRSVTLIRLKFEIKNYSSAFSTENFDNSKFIDNKKNKHTFC